MTDTDAKQCILLRLEMGALTPADVNDLLGLRRWSPRAIRLMQELEHAGKAKWNSKRNQWEKT